VEFGLIDGFAEIVLEIVFWYDVVTDLLGFAIIGPLGVYQFDD
jgi:hypothetical protein